MNEDEYENTERKARNKNSAEHKGTEYNKVTPIRNKSQSFLYSLNGICVVSL